MFGLGNLGFPTALALSARGCIVSGVDIDAERVERINAGENLLPHEKGLQELLQKSVSEKSFSATIDAESAVRNAAIHVIVTPVLFTDNNADVSTVEAVARTISKGLKQGDLVIIESSMPPGGTRRLVPLLEESGLKAGKDFFLAFCPERAYSGSVVSDVLTRFPKIVSGLNKESAERAKAFYGRVCAKGVVLADSLEEAECLKLFEGVYRDVNVALANELSRAASELGVDYWHLREIERKGTEGYVDLHKPGPGVGGHCIPIYPKLLLTVLKGDYKLFPLARELNDAQPQQVVELVKRHASSGKACVLGLAFRGNVREHRNSPALAVIAGLEHAGFEAWCYDPYYGADEIERIAGCRGGTLDECARGAKVIVVVAGHDEYKRIDWAELGAKMANRVVVDCRNIVGGLPDGFLLVRLGAAAPLRCSST
ncbi:hypothetical protein AUJ14_02900 [Candidatus Micrarchaeota archaeon CG1_02_55_22]|nr:MAG: hypothetical protein AUJ14_02900 [Candidatus Micrarchaeota archaeon CG1_02_55_22]